MRDIRQSTGTKVESSDGPSVLGEDSDGGGGQEAPHPDDLVCGPGRDHPVVLADRHVGDLGARATEGEDKSARAGLPHLDKKVIRPREHIAASFVKEKTKHRTEMSKTSSLKL